MFDNTIVKETKLEKEVTEKLKETKSYSYGEEWKNSLIAFQKYYNSQQTLSLINGETRDKIHSIFINCIEPRINKGFCSREIETLMVKSYILFHVMNRHALIDGNKRLAYGLANGYVDSNSELIVSAEPMQMVDILKELIKLSQGYSKQSDVEHILVAIYHALKQGFDGGIEKNKNRKEKTFGEIIELLSKT